MTEENGSDVNNLEEESLETKIFGYDDESLRDLGNILSNISSRKIIKLLINKEMYVNEIAYTLGIKPNVVIFHIKKLVKTGLVTVTNKELKRKGIKHKHYRMTTLNFFVNIDKTQTEIHESGFLKRIFKEGIKFASIVIAGIISWFSSQIILNGQSNMYGFVIDELPNTINNSNSILVSIFFTTTIILIGLVLILIKKKKS